MSKIMETSDDSTVCRASSSQEDFLANLSASPGSEQARLMTAISGRRCCELLSSHDPVGLLVKTLLESYRWNSTKCFLTWKPSTTPRGRLLFRLVPSTPITGETESGFWPTPLVGARIETAHGQVSGRWREAMAMRMFPTRKYTDGTKNVRSQNGMKKEKERKRSNSLPGSINGRPSPEFVEWLMGYQAGHTEFDRSEMRSSLKLRSI